MRTLKAIHIHSFLGIIPLVWFLSFLSILAIGTFKLGYIPQYGNPVDPDTLHIGGLELLHSILFMMSIIAFFGWITVTIILLSFYKNSFVFNKTALVLFAIGVTGFLVFKYVFPGFGAWVFD
ncbi:hypothetical protein [Ferruginibacter sp. SUN106]|uniref:hypothetical protein n=1 Tax=Ferruginibacter sp. SUN106 TaxID=2978348 RepID=UPI003D359B37